MLNLIKTVSSEFEKNNNKKKQTCKIVFQKLPVAFMVEKKLFMDLYIPFFTVDVILQNNIQEYKKKGFQVILERDYFKVSVPFNNNYFNNG